MNLTLIIVISIFALTGCISTGQSSTELFAFKEDQTDNCIAVYGSKTVDAQAFRRAYTDIEKVMDKMHPDIRKGMLKSNVKMLVVENENELENNIDFFMSMLPLEAVFTDNNGFDETLTSDENAGLSTTKLELTYLSVYYAFVTEPMLSDIYVKLQNAYAEAENAGVFSPGEAYEDGYIDEVHQYASEQNALKYGSYMFGLYKLYFGNDRGETGEFTIQMKEELEELNPLGYAFIKTYYDQ